MQRSSINNSILPWQITVFKWFSVGLSSLFLLLILFFAKLGFEGFKAGEMGAMVGIFSIVGLIFLIPIFVFAVIVVIGIFKRKKWSYIASLVFSIIGSLASIIIITIGFLPFILAFTIMAFTIWLNVFCLKYKNE